MSMIDKPEVFSHSVLIQTAALQGQFPGEYVGWSQAAYPADRFWFRHQNGGSKNLFFFSFLFFPSFRKKNLGCNSRENSKAGLCIDKELVT